MICKNCGSIMEKDKDTFEYVCLKCGNIDDSENYVNEEPKKEEQYNISTSKPSIIESIPKEIFKKLSGSTIVDLSKDTSLNKNFMESLQYGVNILTQNRVNKMYIEEFKVKYKRYYMDKSFFNRKRTRIYNYFTIAYIYIFAKLHYIPLSKFYLTKYLVSNINETQNIKNNNNSGTEKINIVVTDYINDFSERQKIYTILSEYINSFIKHFKIKTNVASRITLTQIYINKYVSQYDDLYNNMELLNKLTVFTIQNINMFYKNMQEYDPAQIAEMIFFDFCIKNNLQLDFDKLIDYTILDANIIKEILETKDIL